MRTVAPLSTTEARVALSPAAEGAAPSSPRESAENIPPHNGWILRSGASIPAFTIGTLQWAIGTFCNIIGALMLVAPHQFSAPIYTSLQPSLSFWGIAFLAAGISVLYTSVLAPRSRLIILAHVLVGAVLLMVIPGFVEAGALTETVIYVVVGVGTIAAPAVAARRTTGSSVVTADFFVILLGLCALGSGLLMVTVPEQFSSAMYHTIRFSLPWYGVAFFIIGVAMVVTQLLPGLSRRGNWIAQTLGALSFFTLLFNVSLPNGNWTGVALYGGAGMVLLLLPWLGPSLHLVDPASLRTRVALALATATALPLVIAVAPDAERGERLATVQVLASEQNLAGALAQNVADYVRLHRAAISMIASQPRLPDLSPRAQQELLHGIARAYPDFTYVATTDADGIEIARSDALPPTVARGTPYFDVAKQTNRASLVVFASPILHRTVFAFGEPVHDENGTFAGSVAGLVDASDVAGLLVRGSTMSGGEAYLVNETGRVVAHVDESLVSSFADRSRTPPVSALLAHNSASGSLTYQTWEGQRLAGYAPVPGLLWGVVVERSANDPLAPIRADRVRTFAELLAVMLISGLLGAYAAGLLSEPLGALADAADHLADEETVVTLPRSRITEVARLTNVLHNLRHRLVTRTAERERAETEVRALNVALERRDGERTTQLQSAINGLHEQMGKRQRAEEQVGLALREVQAQYRAVDRARREARAVLDAANDAMLLMAPDQRVLGINRRFTELLGLRASETVGRHFGELHRELTQIFADPDIARARIGGTADDQEQVFTIDLHQVWPEVRQLELFSTPAPGLGRLYVLRDVTREREVDRMKSEFVALVSHELRTPLTSIKGYVDLLLDGEVGPLEDEQLEFLHVVKNNADRLVSLINDLLDVSRIESGKIELRPEPLHLDRVVRSVVATLHPQMEAKQQQLSLGLPASLPRVLGEADRVTQVLMNLLSNAHKYTPKGGSITVTMRADGTMVHVDVRDTGIGLTTHEQQQLFTKFFRAKNRTTDEVGGTGLGLVITRSIVEMHGGTIR